MNLIPAGSREKEPKGSFFCCYMTVWKPLAELAAKDTDMCSGYNYQKMRMKILHNDENILKEKILFERFQKRCYSKISSLQMRRKGAMIFYDSSIRAWEYRAFYSGFEVWRGNIWIQRYKNGD